jgi:hypothetical protein
MIETFLQTVFSEYGAFVLFLVLTNGGLAATIRVLYKQNTHLSNKLLETVENNTRVLTQIVDKLEAHEP